MNVRRSQRPQGKTFILGCLSLIVCVVVFVIFHFWSVDKNPQARQDKRAIQHVYLKFEHAIRHNDFTQAYALMSPSYRKHTKLQWFTLRFRGLQKIDDKLEPQHFITIRRDNTAWLYPKGSSQRAGASYEFEKVQSRWYLTGRMGLIKD